MRIDLPGRTPYPEAAVLARIEATDDLSTLRQMLLVSQAAPASVQRELRVRIKRLTEMGVTPPVRVPAVDMIQMTKEAALNRHPDDSPTAGKSPAHMAAYRSLLEGTRQAIADGATPQVPSD